MQQLARIAALFAVAAAVAGPAYASGINLNGPHYNLNIIGVENPKNSTLTGSDRHTIFVALKNTGSVPSNIYLTQGDFAVCDGNAFDAAYNCSGQKIQNQGAVFQLPCNTNVPADITCVDGTVQASYEVWARALGQPGGSATITTCAFDPLLGEEVCSTENVLLSRNKGKSTFTNVTNQLTSLYADINGDGVLERVALFAGGLEDFVWQYQNNGLRLAQLRFYLVQ